MFSCQIFAKPFLILVGLTAASYINAAPPALTLSPGTLISDPAKDPGHAKLSTMINSLLSGRAQS
jgi:hypothetical protein